MYFKVKTYEENISKFHSGTVKLEAPCIMSVKTMNNRKGFLYGRICNKLISLNLHS